MESEALYIVWSPTGPNPPSVKHPCVEEARAESRRLAAAHPHQQFFVMRAVESVKYRDSPYDIRLYCKR